MFAADTNILLQLFVATDNPQQAAAARALVKMRSPLALHPIVLVEFAWTLKRHFKCDRKQIYLLIGRLLDAPEFFIEQRAAVELALQMYQIGPAGFSDYMIGQLNIAAGCQATVTFDRDAAKSAAFQLLET